MFERPVQSFATINDLPLAKIELVVLDFDGVIADSEIISLATLQETLAHFGIDLSVAETRARFLGTSLRTIGDYVAAHSPRKSAEGFVDHWQSTLFARFRAELQPVPHVLAFLGFLSSRGIRFCIASSGTFERIGVALDAMKMRDHFDHVFSSEQVKNGKPAPDLFLFAAHQLGVSPSACLVIEDSPFGIRAAKAAEMFCAGFVGGAHVTDVELEHGKELMDLGADLVLRSFEAGGLRTTSP